MARSVAVWLSNVPDPMTWVQARWPRDGRSACGIYCLTLLPDPGPGGKLTTDLEGRDDKADEAAIFAGNTRNSRLPRLSEPGATHSSVAAELGVTPTQLKTWRLELEAAGSAAATAAQKAEAAELVQLRRDNKRLTEEVEVLCKAQVLVGERLEHFDGLEGIPHLDPHNRRRPTASMAKRG